MRPKKEILQDYFGVSDPVAARSIHHNNYMNEFDTRPPLDQWITMKFPYKALNHPPLPSIEDIKKATETHNLSGKVCFNWVCRVGECVIKYNDTFSLLQEAETLLYLQQHSKVRVPKLYAVYVEPIPTPEGREGERGEKNMHYLVMEYIKGEVFNPETYLGLDTGSQKKLCARIAEQFQLLRSIPQESDYGDYYGHVNHKGLMPYYTCLQTRGTEMCGPYKTHADMASDMQDSFERHVAMMDNREELSAREHNAFSKLKLGLSNSTYLKPTFTHMDPKFQNMVIQPMDDANGEGEQDWEVTLIDWEYCGWMPAYMQGPAWEQRLYFLRSRESRREFLRQVLGSLDSYEEDMDLLWDVGSTCRFPLL